MKRALISVFDKTGIVEFASNLVEMGWEIVSTGGTSKALKEAGLSVVDVSDITQFPECFDGRVKTLHPKLHGGLLFLRDNEEHVAKRKELAIEPIDVVVCNLYPFKQTVLKPGVSHEEIIENIDIGGPSMLRAAAKNYRFVSVLVDPADYAKVIDELKVGAVSVDTNEYLAAKVFEHTSSYDTLISNYFMSRKPELEFPEKITLTYEKKQSLRYGENPHQNAAYYTEIKDTEGTLSQAVQLHGKELSFNNINDTNGALETLKEFDKPTVVAVKHANPCGIGTAPTIAEAYQKAYDADPVSIFGGIVVTNGEIDEATASQINKIFVEVVVAPSYSEAALGILKSKKNIRLLQLSELAKNDYKSLNIRSVMGGLLVQERDNILLQDELKVVTKRQPSEQEMDDMLFAWKAVKHIKSNGIVLVKDGATVGVGPGQVNRVGALGIAIKQASEKAHNAVMGSDAFFPFSDSVDAAAQAGVTAIIQPGGSIKDQDSIDACDRYGITMVFTGLRHFKH